MQYFNNQGFPFPFQLQGETTLLLGFTGNLHQTVFVLIGRRKKNSNGLVVKTVNMWWILPKDSKLKWYTKYSLRSSSYHCGKPRTLLQTVSHSIIIALGCFETCWDAFPSPESFWISLHFFSSGNFIRQSRSPWSSKSSCKTAMGNLGMSPF